MFERLRPKAGGATFLSIDGDLPGKTHGSLDPGGRSKTWLKTKCFTQSTFVVIGIRKTGALRALFGRTKFNLLLPFFGLSTSAAFAQRVRHKRPRQQGGQLHVIALNPHAIEYRSAHCPSRFCDRRTFRSSHSRRSGDRNCLHCLHHGRGAVMQEDEPVARRFHPPDQHHLPAATYQGGS